MAPEAFDLRLAAPFVVLAEELHFGRAAERLGIRQPALSQQLARLERQLGVSLVERGGGQVGLTPAGVRFLVEARAMLARIRQAQDALRGDGGELRLHVGSTQNAALGDVLASFVAAHPTIVVRTTEGLPTAASHAVRNGEADVAFGMPSDASPDLDYVPVASAALGAFTAVDHPIAAHSRAAWGALEGLAVTVGPFGTTDGSNQLQREVLRRMGVDVREVVTPAVPRAAYMQHQLASGAAVMLAPPWVLFPLPPGVAWTVLEPEEHLELGIMWDGRTAGGSVRRFVDWTRARVTPQTAHAREE